MHQTLIRISAILVLLLIAAGCASTGRAADDHDRGSLFFATPEEAVEITTDLLRSKDWPTLAEYYDLSETPMTRQALARGHFFYSDSTTAEHPGARDMFRYKHPFPPGYRYFRIETTDRPDTFKLITLLEIDQGLGDPQHRTQRSLAAALMRHTDRGWQFLPEHVDP